MIAAIRYNDIYRRDEGCWRFREGGRAARELA
jgi:hypothetical protein